MASEDKIKRVFIGAYHIVYLTEQGRCFACGLNHAGQLGIGDNESKNRPTEINLAHLNLAPGDKIKWVFVGQEHTVYFTEQGRYFDCGRGISFRFR